MAAEVITNASLVVATNDISAWCTDITLEESSDALEDTAFGDTARSRIGGLTDGTLSFTFHLDFAASATYSYLNGLFNTVVAVVVKKDAGGTSATNPSQTTTALVNDNKLLDTSIGALHSTSVTWPLCSAVVHAES